MDVDNNDIEGQLLRQFSSMGTTDKEVLVAELQKLIGNQLNMEGCAFFLDMNNWNLQAAICAYYDYEQPATTSVPSMCLVRDVTIADGEAVPPNTSFLKTWRIQNNGRETWPPGCCLRFVSGDQMGQHERTMINSLAAGQCTDVSVPLVSPGHTGICQGQWRMQTTIGVYFGEIVWAIVSVEENGILGVTQQLSQFRCHTSASSTTAATSSTTNPFAADSMQQRYCVSATSSLPLVVTHDPPITSISGSAICAEMFDSSRHRLQPSTETPTSECVGMETSHDADMA